MLERLISDISGADAVAGEMKKAFLGLIHILPWFDDVKIHGLYLSGSDDLVLSCRQGDKRGIGALYEPNPLYPGLIIYPVKGIISGLRFERVLGGCKLEKEDNDGFVISAEFAVGDYLIPHYAIIKINKESTPVN